MSLNSQLADLYQRDLTRLVQQVQAFPNEDALWACAPGVTNSAGNLALHLEGNLRDFVGRILGGVAYQRQREEEFSGRGVSLGEMTTRLEALRDLIPPIIRLLSQEQMDATYPLVVLGAPLPTQQFLIHLNGHLNYHLGQMDYLRRVLTAGGAVAYAGLA